jgi:hypothetical protein
MEYFQTKNPNLGTFGRVLEWERLVYSMAIWNILWPFGNMLQFGIFLPVLVYLVKKNLATLHPKIRKVVLLAEGTSVFHTLTNG